ncbi:class I glutamine amidotransferase-like protein [Panus rudis PR-1116 ss-1]|nr:class I glutamine amidotransferase-like protein [Panus rudis PR-1116 ss-1]
MTSPFTLKLAVCLFDDVTSLDYSGPVELLSFIAPKAVATADFGVKRNIPVIVPPTFLNYTRDPVKPMSGPDVLVNKAYDDVGPDEQFDIILVPGGLGSRPDRVQPSLIRFLQRQAPGAKYVLSVCTGSWILAQAGLLDGKRATTNKASFKRTKEATAQQKIEWVPKARWVIDGKTWTASGVTAGIDMASAFLDELVGQDIAQDIRGIVEVSARDQGDDEFADFYGLL